MATRQHIDDQTTMCVFKRRSTIHLLNQVKLSNKVLHQPTTDLEIAPFTISEQRLS